MINEGVLRKINIVMQNRLKNDTDGKLRKQLSVTIATRFDPETAIILREVAQEKGIGITTLIRMWTLDRLRRLNKTNRPTGLIDFGFSADGRQPVKTAHRR